MKLYHGSAYEQNELMPGFLRSGELVEWDKEESNKYLYATTDREKAIELGFASSVEKQYPMDRFTAKDNSLHFVIDAKKLPTLNDLSKVPVYLYEIEYDTDSGWIKNHNPHNNMITEFKTDQVIESSMILRRIKIDLKNWLKQKKVTITSPRPSFMNW